MKTLRLILIVFSLSSSAFAAKYGGVWIETNRTAYTLGMRTSNWSPKQNDASGAGIWIGSSYETYLDSIPAGDSIYTRGISERGYYSKDSSNADTMALNLSGILGNYVRINAYFFWNQRDSLFMVVEQALSYRPIASDTAIAHGAIKRFNDGFVTTDTLFADSLVATLDTFYVSGSTSDSCSIYRMWQDSFKIVSPYVRIKSINKGKVTRNQRPIMFELYGRNSNDVLGGASGRMIDYNPKAR